MITKRLCRVGVGRWTLAPRHYERLARPTRVGVGRWPRTLSTTGDRPTRAGVGQWDDRCAQRLVAVHPCGRGTMGTGRPRSGAHPCGRGTMVSHSWHRSHVTAHPCGRGAMDACGQRRGPASGSLVWAWDDGSVRGAFRLCSVHPCVRGTMGYDAQYQLRLDGSSVRVWDDGPSDRTLMFGFSVRAWDDGTASGSSTWCSTAHGSPVLAWDGGATAMRGSRAAVLIRARVGRWLISDGIFRFTRARVGRWGAYGVRPGIGNGSSVCVWDDGTASAIFSYLRGCQRRYQREHHQGEEGVMKEDRFTCQRSDRHSPTMTCGYPLPCPWHTVIIDAPGGLNSDARPATVTIPVTSSAMLSPTRERLGEVARALTKEKKSGPRAR
jgi:hypothetical protein